MPIIPPPVALDTLSTLDRITIKVRRLTKSPSQAQIDDQTIWDYINTFVLYDFSESVRLFNLRTTLTFYTEPYINTYGTNYTDPNDPLYNFLNQYITVESPIYVNGRLASFSLSPTEFNANYPTNMIITQIATGTGINSTYTGTLDNPPGGSAVPVLRNKVFFNSIDATNQGLTVYDDGNSNLLSDGTIVGLINYVTGQYAFTFPFPPAAGAIINSNTLPFLPSIPNNVLYFDSQFTFYPVPDLPYRVDVTVMQRPTALLSGTQCPLLAEWWQYIAYGAAIKILQDRLDMDTVGLIWPEFERQQQMVIRRTIQQQAFSQVATIYNCDMRLDTYKDNGVVV